MGDGVSRPCREQSGNNMDEVKRFLNEMKTDPRAAALVKPMEVPKSDAEAAEVYLRLAGLLGFHITREDLADYISEQSQRQQARTARAESRISMDESDLESVSGGFTIKTNPCEETYTSGEWCWWNDSCYEVINIYD